MADEINMNNHTMKVLLFSFSTQSGTGQYPAQLANGLACHVDVHVICPDTPVVEELFCNHITLHRYQVELQSGIHPLINGLRGLAEQRQLTAEIDPDLIHLPFLNPHRAVTLLPVLKTVNIPIVATVHDPLSHSGMRVGPMNIDPYARVSAVASRLLDAVIVHGQACLNQANVAGYPMDRVHAVPHGMFDHFLEYEYKKHTTEPNMVLFFGNIRENKGYDRIPGILDIVQQRVPNVKGIVAGSPTNARRVDHNTIEKIVDTLRKDDRIELHNRYIPDEEVGEFFSKSAAVVLPYYDASSSGVVMTAYAFKTPIVATDVGELGGILTRDETGLVVDPASDEAIGNAVAQLLTDDDLRMKLKHNLTRCRDRYNWTRIAERTVEIYQNLL